ncbi:DUF86 domain-containing protein [Paenibacillus sp. JX-17]|uniref:DUF86 domain-containing protein n=1 Tax=Paenibacillus lacisoli TaxID=3064525 RepID=A0ABT9C9W7_9BACL|nr:HepT-like ribonuclease domain-containing protein [Paenibacillus sp. JX-17]MDO7906048.1 DUF86 domain-containing protein [Paenibacillus sp. JX-17]
MYYVNREQIELRLNAVPAIASALRQAAEDWDGGLLYGMVQERALHLGIETVTDVGSYLIDGFIMRDASSYEDIIEINFNEGVFSREIYEVLMKLVGLRKPLVQDYYVWERSALHDLTPVLPAVLEQFAGAVHAYLDQELGAAAPVEQE